MKRITVLILLLTMCVVCLAGCGKETLDVKDYIEISYGQYSNSSIYQYFDDSKHDNGKSTAKASLNDEFYKQVSYLLGDYDVSKMLLIQDAVKFEITPNGNLSNGDKITVKATIEKDALKSFDFDIKGGTFTYTVSGLTERQYTEINPFDGIELNVTGQSPFLTVSAPHTLSVPTDKHWQIEGKFSIAKTTNDKKYYAVGDRVTVLYEYNAVKAEEQYIKITQTSKEFVVSGDTFITSLDQLNQDELNRMMQDAESVLQAGLSQDRWSSPKIDKERFILADNAKCTYLGDVTFVAKEEHVFSYPQVGIALVFKVPMKSTTGYDNPNSPYYHKEVDVYTIVNVYSLTRKADGTLLHEAHKPFYNNLYAFDLKTLHAKYVETHGEKYHITENMQFE